MSEVQFSALFLRINNDADFRAKLQAAADLDAALALAGDAGYSITKKDWLDYEAKVQSQEMDSLGDEALESLAGGQFAYNGIYQLSMRFCERIQNYETNQS